LEARRDLITTMLATNTVATVGQRLRDEHGLAVSQSSLHRYVAQALPDEGAAAAGVTVLRPSAPPGEAQIDYGYLGRWVDPVGGRVHRVQAFVIVLACSRHMFVRPVLSMDQTSWVNRPGFGGGSEPTKGWSRCRHRGSTRRSCGTGRSGWSLRPGRKIRGCR